MTKVFFIIYIVSWLILVAMYVCSLSCKNRSADKAAWYLYALIIAFAQWEIRFRRWGERSLGTT